MTTVTGGDVRRAELATFLRSRRERITPADVGLPPRTRTRTPGLRREDVAQLAGVGVTWYTWLEQGRPIRVSTQVLDAVARALRLGRDEHEHLYRLADVPSAEGTHEPAMSQLDPEVRIILGELTSMAAVINERCDLLASNGAFDAVLPSIAPWRKDRRYHNLLWMVFTMPLCCHPYVNWEDEAPRLVARLYAAYGHHVGEPAWETFISDLSAASPEFASLWREHRIAGHGTHLRILRHPAVGLLRFSITYLGVLATPSLRMLIYVPRDAETEAGVRAVVNGEVRCPTVLPCGHRISHAGG